MEPKPKFRIIKSRRNKPMLVVNEMYLYNFICKNTKTNTDTYRCQKYKSSFHCNAYIKIKDNEITSFINNHNHESNDINVIKEEAKLKIKEEIFKSSDPFSIKPKKLVKSFSTQNGLKFPSYNTLKTFLYEQINKNLPSNINSFEEAPVNSIYYKTIKDEEFLIYRDDNLMIFQSPDQAKIHLKYGKIIFADATFFSCPNLAYQLFIIRVHSLIDNIYYTTSFSLMKNKTEKDYALIFKKLSNNISHYLDIGEEYNIFEIHTDFEKAIGEGCKQIFPKIKIKYCIWHLLRLLEINKNKLCYQEVNEDNKIFGFYNTIKNLYLCDPSYVKIVFNIIENENTNKNFGLFLEYFKKEYLKIFPVEGWNYYLDYRYCTNNACEGYNSKLNKLFQSKPSFFKLLHELRYEEQDIVNTYYKRINGLIGSNNRRNFQTFNKLEILKDDIKSLNELPEDNSDNKKKKGYAWIDALKKLGSRIFN